MRVAGVDQAAVEPNRHEERRPGNHLFDVDVSRVLPRCDRADRNAARMRHTEGALERSQLEFDVRRKLHVTVAAVQIEIVDVSVLELIMQRSGAQLAGVVKVGAEADRA